MVKKGVFCIEDKEQKRWFLHKNGVKKGKNGQKRCFSLEDKEQKRWFLGGKIGQKQVKNGQKRGYFSSKTLELPFLIFYTENRFPGRFWPFFFCIEDKGHFFEAGPPVF